MKTDRITRTDVNLLKLAVQAEAIRTERLKKAPPDEKGHPNAKTLAHMDAYVDRLRRALEKVTRVAKAQLEESKRGSK